MKKSHLIVLGIVAAGLAVLTFSFRHKASASNNLKMTDSSAATSAIPSSDHGQSVDQTFTVTGGNFSYDLKEVKVKKGETVRIIFKNAEGFHDFRIDELNVATNKIKAGAQESVVFTADKSGTFEYYCSVGKHRAMGMKGNLIVE